MKIRLRLNNKGNTLGIVLIGIFILSILGTLILGLTSTNLNMKLVDKKTEMTFYYAEKAMDELYAAIGGEVMECAKQSYSEVVENYVSSSGTLLTSSQANAKFKEYFLRGNVSAAIEGITNLYKDGVIVSSATGNIDEMFGRFENNRYISDINRYKFNIISPTSEPTEIIYKKADGQILLSGNVEDVAVIEIKNIGVECESVNTGFYSSIVTDFEIKVPEIDMNFSDSASVNVLDDFAKYSLIAQGSNDVYTTNKTEPAIQIDSNWNVTVNGNVYAGGTVYQTDASGNKTVLGTNPSINLNPNSRFTLNSKILACENDFVLNNASAELGNYTGTDSIDAGDSLQFYARNILTEGTEADSRLEIQGNCIVSDDLELNGDNSNINIKGNYFGYGFRASASDSRREADTNEITGFISSTATATEHKQSSAIIINGKNADLKMNEVRKLILAGRAYIDLDANGTNASYMTGESVSIKGNQHMYLADRELVGSLVSQNPILYTTLRNMDGVCDNGNDITYSALRLNTMVNNHVVAKKINDDVYFYVSNINPVEQTEYFLDTYANDQDKTNQMKQQIENLGVRNILFSDSVKAYTVGAIYKVVNGRMDAVNLSYGSLNGLTADGSTTELGFYDILNDIDRRKANLIPSLKDVNYDNSVLGLQETTEIATPSDKTPFEYYINKANISSIPAFSPKRADDLLGASPSISGLSASEAQNLASQILSILGPSYSGKNVGYIITNNGSSTTHIGLDAGVVVANNPVSLEKDFTGMVICNETIYFRGHSEISSAEELVQLMFTAIPDLRNILSDELNISGITESGYIVKSDSLKYTDFVKKSNWRKNFK